MKKNSTMVTLVLALVVGCALIIGSVFSLYREKNRATEEEISAITDTKLDIANQKVAILENQIVESKEKFDTIETTLTKLQTDSYEEVIDQNIPIIEITDTDIAEKAEFEDSEKKVHRLMYNHQLKFQMVNVGKYSLKDVIFSVKDIYNESPEKKRKKKTKQYEYMGQIFDSEDIGRYNNIEVNTLNLKSKRLVYISNLPSSFGVADYYYDIIVEWSKGFYQMHVDVEELDGKLKYRYQFYDINGKKLALNSTSQKI